MAFGFPNVPNGLGSSALSVSEKELEGAEGTALVCPNPPNALGSSALSLDVKGLDDDEPPNENSEAVDNGEVVPCNPPPNVPGEVDELNEKPLPKLSAGLLAPLDC